MNTIRINNLKNEFDIELITDQVPSKISVVGVGGGGSKMIDHMIRKKEINNVDFMVVDTDIYALDRSLALSKMLLGDAITRSIGSGLGSFRGRKSAIKSFDEIKRMLEGSDIVFILSGFGNCTGTGATPIIAQAAKAIGALTVSIVTNPFKLEGRERMKLAKNEIEELKKMSDSIFVIPNDRFSSITETNFISEENFRIVNDILLEVVSTISKVIIKEEEIFISLHYTSIKDIISCKGFAHIGTGYSVGKNAAYHATKETLESPLLANVSMDDVMGIYVHFVIHPDYPMMEIGEGMCILEESVNEDAPVTCSTTTDNDMNIDEVKIIIIATGLNN